MASTTVTSNRKIALCIIGITILASIIASLYFYTSPENAFARLNDASIKFILIITSNLILALIGLTIYGYIYLPRPRRLVLFLIRSIMLIGVILLGTPMGIASLETAKATIQEHGSLELNFAHSDPIPLATIFFTMIFGIVILSFMYIWLAKLESDMGCPLE